MEVKIALTESLMLPGRGLEQNERPALIKNKASGLKSCNPGRIGLYPAPFSFDFI